MSHDLKLFAVAFVTSLAIVEATLYSAYSNAASHVALVLLSLVVADVGLSALDRSLPRRLLPDLRGKAVLVTGCDSGFGQECARRLDALGVAVYAGCLLPDGAGAAALKASASSRLHIVPLDVTKDDSVQAAVQFVKNTIGDKALWAVVNNAGVLSVGELQWTSMEQIEKVFQVNLIGMVRTTKAFLDMVIESKGRIVCIGSCAGRVTWPPLLVYSMSKHAVVAFVDGLRRQMKNWSVTVHCIQPFMYKTNIISEDNIRDIIRRDWFSCPSKVRQQYGEKYFTTYVDSLVNFVNFVYWKSMAAVADSMVDAAVGASPKVTYTCGIFATWIVSLIPDRIMDAILEFLPPITCRPAALQPNWEGKKLEE